MKPSHVTPTTFERYSSRNQTRQTITVLSLSVGSAFCAIESIVLDGQDVPVYVVWIAKRGIPRSILANITASNIRRV